MATATQKALTKAQLMSELAERTELPRKGVADLFDKLHDIIKRELTRGAGVFTLPGLVKLKKVVKPATKERTGPDPFNKGQIRTFPAKPKRTVAKALALKALKDMVA